MAEVRGCNDSRRIEAVTLIQGPALRGRLGARGREIAEAEFSQERVVAETLAVYRELLAGCASLRPQVA